MSKRALYIKMFAAGAVMCVGGPALIIYVTPTEEELFKRYNPELQKRSLANREERQQDFDNFVGKIKEYSKSSKPIWAAAAEDEARTKANSAEEQRRVADEIQKRREEIKRHSLNG
ncbi:MAG: cbp4 domain-containing [Lasallia pustulata]|uniref:Cytochrome b mRNA-processing protein 4 n=1 Tax=Lasallia pustulata TaxID=136370 RepID=A0A1W5DBK8_9LECA|nr:MAG: cbp4 domain-containing [Lasallia pustulata]SLM40528.1 cbp4 domain-containing protein [Lasallia pustulata]